MSLIENWAYASHVMQANEGPSFIAHQYAIAGQSGGLYGIMPSPAATAYAMAENPGTPPPIPTPTPTPLGQVTYVENGIGTTGNCYTPSQVVFSVNMALPYTTGSDQSNPFYPPCEEYNTVLDEVSGTLTRPPYFDWQYIAEDKTSIWAAPMGVNHLYQAYAANETDPTQPFAVDKDAVNFVANLGLPGGPPPNPARPIAALTYITPCKTESDHPDTTPGTVDNGPQWLGWLINSIGASAYWPNTTIIVTWDDWGGFYDHWKAPPPNSWPYHPPQNVYFDNWPTNDDQDGNEWGFRVPVIIISPYVQQRGYISAAPPQPGAQRSQSVILDYVESTFGLPPGALGTDDKYQTNDALKDVFNFNASPMAYTPVPGVTFTPPPGGCGN